tara:strand:+ start:271 stop:492 length:222 start_codon:yes stop_codon:yes gene_type:complete
MRINEKQKQLDMKDFQSLQQKLSTQRVSIVPTYENLLVSYARLYSNMTEEGKKQIELQLSKIGVALDNLNKGK